MKTLHRFILKSFAGPFFITFCIALFVLLMHFVWLYIDDLVGKGLEARIIAQLLFYTTVTLVPMALPLSILLSSLMTFGNLGENYELVAMKSSGISLQRIMFPLILLSLFFSGIAFYFSNTVLPHANLKMKSLLYDVRESKPFLKIKEGIFYNDIDRYSIRVGKKDKNTGDIEDVMIYDHTAGLGNNKVIVAEKGNMKMSAGKEKLLITLYNGYSYEEKLGTPEEQRSRPHVRVKFREQTVQFDLSEFELKRTEEDLFKSNYDMLNLEQLTQGMDSLKKRSESRRQDLLKILNESGVVQKNIRRSDSVAADTGSRNFFSGLKKPDKIKTIETAINLVNTRKTIAGSIKNEMEIEKNTLKRFEIEYHKKFTLSIACLILFFIGAPLGAIIRKGGLGMPVVVSVIFFIFFHVLSISGEKAAREGALDVFTGMWLASAVLLPLGIFLTWKSTTDSALLDAAVYQDLFRKLFRKQSRAAYKAE